MRDRKSFLALIGLCPLTSSIIMGLFADCATCMWACICNRTGGGLGFKP